MSWAEVKKINSDMRKPLDVLIKEGVKGGIIPSNMVVFDTVGRNGEVALYIKGPNDTIIDDQLLSTITGVKIMRKDTEYPNTENAGILVIDIPREDLAKYAIDPYVDSGLKNGKTYYYAAFPYSDYGAYNRNPINRAKATPKDYELYGYDEDQSDSNPATRITYPSDVDNAKWEPMKVDLTTGDYDLRSWKDVFFIKKTRPVMLKYDGTVDYELNHKDQTKKLDGTPSDISNTAYGGNAMTEFSKMYFKRWQDADDTKHVRISDKKLDNTYLCYQHMYDGNELDTIYLPMFEGSSVGGKVRSIAGQTPMNSQSGATEWTQIQANGSGWIFDDFMDKQMVKDLLFLLGKSTDSQATFGNGHMSGGNGAGSLLRTGTLKDKGMFYGTSGNVAVKFFWLENYYGDRWDRTFGLVYGTDGHIKVKPYPPYNIDGTGYIDTGITIAGSSGGYISKTKMTEYGDFPVQVSGSETTYIPDGCWFDTSQLHFLLWGVLCIFDRGVGVAGFAVNYPFSSAYWDFGPSLAYKHPKAA